MTAVEKEAMADKIVKIGGAAGASIDSAIVVPQLLGVPR
jgi:hypothetical protein